MKASNWRFEVYGALAAALILPPVLWLLAAAAGGVLRHGPAAPDVVSLALLARSVLVGSGAALLALLLGVPYGWMVARRRLPGQRFWMPASLLSLLLPPYAATLAWQVLLAREGAVNTWLVHAGWLRAPVSPDECLGAAAIILGLAYWPVAAWLTWFAARSVPRALEEAARLHLPDAAAAAWSAGPALWRAVPSRRAPRTCARSTPRGRARGRPG